MQFIIFIEFSGSKSYIANLNFNKSQTKAPYTGIVEEKYIEIGEYVSTGTKLFQRKSIIIGRGLV